VILGPSACRPFDPIFPMDATGTGFYREWFTPTLTKAGIAGYNWHANRHTFCSWLAMGGASIKEIQVLEQS
jgi:site-specific recombinase XerD